MNWRQLSKLVAMICLVQAIYWLLVEKPLFRVNASEAPPAVEQVRTQIARLSAPTLADAARADFSDVELPWTHCCDTAMFAVRVTFRLDDVPPAGLGMISQLQVDNYRLYVNGSLLVGEGRMESGNGTFHGQKTFLTRMPAGLLKRGDNVLTYITLRDGFPYTDIFPPQIGEFEAMRSFSARRLWALNDFPRYSAGLLGLLGLLATVMVFRSDDWRFAAWLSALCGAFVANYLYGVELAPPFDGWGRMFAFFAINMFIPTALLCFIDAWTRRPLGWLMPLALSIYLAAAGYIAWRIYTTSMPDAFDVPAIVWIWMLAGLSIATLARLLWHFARAPEDRLTESALMSVLAVATLLDALCNLFPEWQLREGYLINAAPFLMLAMLTAFLARNFRLFQSQTALNTLLQAKVAQREAELAVAHMREQEFVRQQAHDAERRRIMQDIHDGLGSQLMSMMLSARLGEAEPAQVAEGLQAVIDEMRLMVDSMDSVGESLEAAFATFRARMQPRVVAAGLQLDWFQAEGLRLPDYGPREVLQLFRILQEAVTNALKHSGASRLAVEIGPEGDGAVVVRISDNGQGRAIPGVGRGLGNMARRAEAIGAGFALSSAPGEGTRVSIHLRYEAIAVA
ncbi:MAG: sensor histidine kinase [Novosphingobium sp.]|uniref:sensor histidine kinase n=1 Tax=Novosphingobium sp. TaxID=1874826 RepID=UPI003B9D96BA